MRENDRDSELLSSSSSEPRSSAKLPRDLLGLSAEGERRRRTRKYRRFRTAEICRRRMVQASSNECAILVAAARRRPRIWVAVLCLRCTNTRTSRTIVNTAIHSTMRTPTRFVVWPFKGGLSLWLCRSCTIVPRR